jgi:hypothetical protein
MAEPLVTTPIFSEETGLTIIRSLNPVEVFADGGMTPLLEKIRQQVMTYVPNVDTAAGRQDIRSLAYKVAQSKTALDSLGKDLVADWKAKAKRVDEARRQAREYLDALKMEVRQPLTDYEEAEKAREAAEALEKEIIVAWGEAHREHELFLQRKAQEAREKEIAKKERELAEKEAAARAAEERRIREEKIAQEAAARAKWESEVKAQREIAAARVAQIRAEDEAKMAQVRAEAELKRQQEAVRVYDEAKARDRQHRSRIIREAHDSMLAAGIDDDIAAIVLDAIMDGKVAHVTLNF